MPVRVPLEFVRETMQLAAPLADTDGRLLAGRGTVLGERIVRALRKMAIQTVVVLDSPDLQAWETVRSLREDLRALERRFEKGLDEPERPEMTALHHAIGRCLERRWAHLDDAGAPDPAEVARP